MPILMMPSLNALRYCSLNTAVMRGALLLIVWATVVLIVVGELQLSTSTSQTQSSTIATPPPVVAAAAAAAIPPFDRQFCLESHLKRIYRVLTGTNVNKHAQKCSSEVMAAIVDPYAASNLKTNSNTARNASCPNFDPRICATSDDPTVHAVEWIVYASRCTSGLNRLAKLIAAAKGGFILSEPSKIQISHLKGIKFTILGMEVEWLGWAQRVRTYYDHLISLDPNALVVITDADDVLMVPGCAASDLVDGYFRRGGDGSSMTSPILFGAERLAWPPTPDSALLQENLVSRPLPVRDPRIQGRIPSGSPPGTPYPPPSIFKYLNAGSFMARAGDAAQLIKATYTDGCLDDQIVFGKAYMAPILSYHTTNTAAASAAKKSSTSTLASTTAHPFLSNISTILTIEPAQLVTALEIAQSTAARAAADFGTGSSAHREALDRVYEAGVKKFIAEAQSEGNTRVVRVETGGWFSSVTAAANNVPPHARPLISLDHDADLILNVGGITLKGIKYDEKTRRIVVEKTGGRPCIVHQPGKKLFNRPVEELSKLFGLEWDEDAVKKAAEVLKTLTPKEEPDYPVNL
ncbi:hypothetical protein HK100_008264 [Physocladia obscura]|uniref:Uncharacterized protein n=1 Tax=Physocladia obscura TaxID=109957 RepID=A0AAD5TAU4_9FUNG|nr:hypothetical protein HK100_008264 [Physocladia obscura]